MRLFFALWPDDEVLTQFEAAANLLRLEAGGRLVAARNLHLTLAFVGEVADEKLAQLQRVARSLRAPRFAVTCDELQYWPNPHAVVAAAQTPPAALLDLSTRLHLAMGLRQEPLRAHVTLARKVAQAPVLPAMSPIVWLATQFSLIRSQTSSAGSSYTVVDTWPLLYEA